MERTEQGNYRQLAEEISQVLQSAAETAEKMVEDARAEATRIRGEAEAELRMAYTDGRRILDEARTEADMMRAEAEWQSQEIAAQAQRQAAEQMAGADRRLAELRNAEGLVMGRLAGVGQVLANALESLQRGPGVAATATGAGTLDGAPAPADDIDQPTAKVYFVEFPPAAHAGEAPTAGAETETERETEIVLATPSGASLFADDMERSEWAPPSELPAWWTRGGAQA
jgi:vacuolar-type H+-ATPase subunit H